MDQCRRESTRDGRATTTDGAAKLTTSMDSLTEVGGAYRWHGHHLKHLQMIDTGSIASQDDIALLKSTESTAWTSVRTPRLTNNATEAGSSASRPIEASQPYYYYKICCSLAKKRLVVLVTDLRHGVHYEELDDLRAIHTRIRVCARESSKRRTDSQDQSQDQSPTQSQSQTQEEGSQISQLGQEEAVSQLFLELMNFSLTSGQTSELHIPSYTEDSLTASTGHGDPYLLLHLPSLTFRFRLDRMSPELSNRLLSDLFISPLIRVAQAILDAGVTKLEEHPHVSGSEAFWSELGKGPLTLSDIDRPSTKQQRSLHWSKMSCSRPCNVLCRPVQGYRRRTEVDIL